MNKKTFMYLVIIIATIINIVFYLSINNYIEVLNYCFNKQIVLDTKNYTFICSIFALISILIVLAIKLVVYPKNNEIKGVKFKKEDRHIWNCKLDVR